MTQLDLHRSGDCWPDTCPICADECDMCGERLARCICPTLPLDDDQYHGPRSPADYLPPLDEENDQ